MEKRTSLRALGAPTPIRVRTDEEGWPVAVALPDESPRRVEAIRESWRIDDEWWRRPISRLYHEVVLETGAILTLYLDLEEGGWYVHGGAGGGKTGRGRSGRGRTGHGRTEGKARRRPGAMRPGSSPPHRTRTRGGG
jgi:hypothetical protein